MDLQNLGRYMLAAGIGLALLGGLLMLLSRVPLLSSFGRLPGDIRLEGQHFSCFVPLASMIILSVVLTIALNIVIRLLNR